MLGFPAQILPMMGFSSCNNSDVFQWPKLVSIGGSCSEPFSHLQHVGVWMQGVVWSCTAGRVWYTMCQYVGELWRCVRDASEKCGVQYAGSYSDRSHESDFHGITWFGSKICHRSVTCVTCHTCVTVCDSAPPLGQGQKQDKYLQEKEIEHITGGKWLWRKWRNL